MQSKYLKLIIALAILLIFGGLFYYWYFTVKNPKIIKVPEDESSQGFSPLNRPFNSNNPTDNTFSSTTDEKIDPNVPPPKLRQISTFPIGGMVASSTASSSLVRFIDRGTGHIYEAHSTSSIVDKISNTTLLRIYESFWNKNGDALISRSLKTDSDEITNFYIELRKKSELSTTSTPFDSRGKFLSSQIDEISVSPDGSKVFTWNIENSGGVGYISSFNESSKTKVISLPFTETLVDWPETNTLTIVTKPSSAYKGYLYSINAKNGSLKRLLGGYRGLMAKVNKDATKIIYSGTQENKFRMGVYDIKTGKSDIDTINTLAEKCVWSNKDKKVAYCAVPNSIPDGNYPDDWYKGSVLFVDKLWHIDTESGEVHMLANFLGLSDSLIDATSLTLDPKEEMIYFINKRDFTLWSFDLTP